MKFGTHSISAAEGARSAKRRVGRGIGSGFGKTAGRGHKGQKSRSGGFHKVGFEGGQMPLYRRLPKRGFVRISECSELRLSALEKLTGDIVSMETLKAQKIISKVAKKIKLIANGAVSRSFTVSGVSLTKGARKIIENAGGTVSDADS